MMAQVPFNQDDAVELNLPMTQRMDDLGNLKINLKNFEKLSILEKCLQEDFSFIEIGSGRGYFVNELYKKGKGKYFGLEPIPSEHKISLDNIKKYAEKEFDKATLKEILGRVELGTIEEKDYPEGSFDLITSYHVFEHLVNPLVMFEKASKWLKPGGRLVITCPNVEGYVPRKSLADWRCNLPSHRWLPGKSVLLNLFKQSNFKIEKYFTYGGYPSPRTFWQELMNTSFGILGQGDVMVVCGLKE